MMRIIYLLVLVFPFVCFGQWDAMLLASQQQASATSDPYLAGDGTGGAPVQYSNANTLAATLSDGNSVTSWPDLGANGYDWGTWGAAPTYDDTSGFSQITFDGTDDGLHLASNHAELDFDPDVDDYTIIIHFGDVTIDNFLAYVLAKGSTGASAQFWLRTNSSGDNLNWRAGGSSENITSLRTSGPDSYVVFRRNGGDVDIYVNNSLSVSATPGTTANETDPWSIGKRSDSSSGGEQTMSIRKIVFYDYAADLTWLGTRYTNRTSE